MTTKNESHICNATAIPSSLDRRRFLRNSSGIMALTAFPLAALSYKKVEAVDLSDDVRYSRLRRNRAFKIRVDAAKYQGMQPLPVQVNNGDDISFSNKIASFSKGLPHDNLGHPDISAYGVLTHALYTQNQADFEMIPLGGTVKLVNPQASYTYALEGPDSHHLYLPAAPKFSSAETAAEAVELYWHSLVRDVHFDDYPTDPDVLAACTELSGLSAFRGPSVGGQVTPETLFRGAASGNLTGPYLSQFLLMDIPYGPMLIPQKINTVLPGLDFSTQYDEWLAVQNGSVPSRSSYDPQVRYLRNGRDLAEYVRKDVTFQAYHNACLILLGLRAPFDAANPYLASKTQYGAMTFGAPHVIDLLTRVSNTALNASFYQKWLLHKRCRPEEYAGRVHNLRTGAANYPIHPDVLNSQALQQSYLRHGTYLLPAAYPEGAPTHPAYPAAHATLAGACVTILKAFFSESWVLPKAYTASADGLALVPYGGATLTVGGELDKLAANIAIGRDFAGVHWRSDSIQGLLLGEALALGILHDYRNTYNEAFAGFSVTLFDGSTVVA